MTSTSLTETKTTALAGPMDLDSMSQDAGQGLENVGTADIAIPFVVILQKLSPQCDKKEEKYIKGAEEGMIMNSLTRELYPERITVVPCAFEKLAMEWKPRDSGGGLQNIHRDLNILSKTKRNDKGQDVLPNGNNIVTTAQHYVLLLDDTGAVIDRVVVSLSSTQLKKSRKWLAFISSKMLKTSAGKPFLAPSFAFSYVLSTVAEKNTKGSWMGWNIEHGSPEPVSPETYALGKAFNDAFRKNLVKTVPVTEDVTPAAGDTGAPDDEF